MSASSSSTRRLRFVGVVGVLATFVYFHGFDCAPWFRDAEALIVTALFGVFAFEAWSNVRRDSASRSKPLRLVEPALVSSVAMAIVYRIGAGYFELDRAPHHLEILGVHVGLLVLAGIAVAREVGEPVVDRMLRLHPAVAFAVSYVVLCLLGACLLMLPEMTVSGSGIAPLDALFTSISASCVTGLTVVDTATYFSFKGQLIILALVQFGGLNVISFATYFLIYGSRAAVPEAERAEVEEFLHADARSHLYRTLALTTAVSLAVELSAAGAIFLGWRDALPAESMTGSLFSALFHSVSAFNNAGFSIHTDGLAHPSLRDAIGLHGVIAALIVLGGLGVPILYGIAKARFDAASRVAASWAVALILVGALGFLVLESEASLSGKSPVDSAASALFQSVTARTAGFNTVEIQSLSAGTLALLAGLMFIGASTGSTGGGIKTSTAAVLAAGVVGFQQRRRAVLCGAPVAPALMRKAVWITAFAVLTVAVGTATLAWFEPQTALRDLAFEEVSAFATVGLSTGVTPHLSDGGKGVVMLTILIGRIGPLGLGLTLFGSSVRRAVRHTEFLVG